MKIWLVRERSYKSTLGPYYLKGWLVVFFCPGNNPPKRTKDSWEATENASVVYFGKTKFPEITWESGPVEVELVRKEELENMKITNKILKKKGEL